MMMMEATIFFMFYLAEESVADDVDACDVYLDDGIGDGYES